MKIIYLLILSIFFLYLTSGTQQTLGTFQQNQPVNLVQSCDNSTYSNITRVVYPNSAFALNGQYGMVKSGNDYYYNYNLTDKLGTYLVFGVCNENNIPTIWGYDLLITKNGEQNRGENYDIFLYLLFIVATLGLFYTFFLCLAKLVTAQETIYGVLISWSTYILMMIVNHLSNYQLSTYITDLSNTFLSITPWTNVVLPLIAFVISFFIKSTQKMKPLTVQEVGGFR